MSNKMSELKTDEDKIGFVYDRFEATYDAWKEDLDNAKKAVRYYIGDSLTDSQKRNLAWAKLPKIENNICKPKVDLMTGLERETRTGFKAYAIDNSDQMVATGVDYTIEYIKNSNNFDAVSSRVFKDGEIGGLANYWVDTKLAKDFTVDVNITREPIGNVLWDPESIELDPNEDADFVIRQRWMTPDKVASIYKLNTETMQVDMSERGDMPRTGVEDGSYYRNTGDRKTSMYSDALSGRVRVLEYWYKKYKSVAYFIDNETGEVIQSPLPIKKAEGVAERYAGANYQMVVKRDYEIWLMTVSGNEVLVDKKSPYAHNMFPAVPSYAYVEDDGEKVRRFGIVKNLFDLQDEKNSRHTQVSQILKTAPIGGGFVKKNSADISVLNQIGGVQRWTEVNRIDDIKERGFNHLPILQQIAALEQITEQDAKEATGLNDPMLGIPTGSKESGLAAQVRIRQGTRTVQELFDNHDKARLLVMRMAFMLARQYFDRRKLLRIMGSMTSDNGQQKAQVITEAMLRNNAMMQYDIKLDKGENSVTERNATFLKTMELLQVAPEYRQVLLPYAIKLMNHPDRDEILSAIGIQSRKTDIQNVIGMLDGGGPAAPKAPNGKQNTQQQVAE